MILTYASCRVTVDLNDLTTPGITAGSHPSSSWHIDCIHYCKRRRRRAIDAWNRLKGSDTTTFKRKHVILREYRWPRRVSEKNLLQNMYLLLRKRHILQFFVSMLSLYNELNTILNSHLNRLNLENYPVLRQFYHTTMKLTAESAFGALLDESEITCVP